MQSENNRDIGDLKRLSNYVKLFNTFTNRELGPLQGAEWRRQFDKISLMNDPLLGTYDWYRGKRKRFEKLSKVFFRKVFEVASG